MTQRDRLVIIGHPVSQSLSPVMHNAALAAKGWDLRYERLDVAPESLADALAALARTRCGGNITIPHKRTALASMRVVSDIAHKVGAVNTFWGDGYGALDGDNTDVAGFEESVRDLLGGIPSGLRIAVLGTGGAAAAALTAIDTWPSASASVHARDLARAMSAQMRHSAVVRVCSMRDPCLSDADLIVNATPIGMGNDEIPIDMGQLRSGAAVLDMVYSAQETRFVRESRDAGHKAIDGLRMLLHQGVAAFRLWFKEDPDADVMWSALKSETGRAG
ncbi:MAG TPA: shikimate dehydrogenase [Gemmatimonadaceae bacterium]|nr:shikimate dehydrogenase [Gemmatimonadaceae bacterium]